MTNETLKLFDLRGKVAVVTGGGSGLGREFCDVLAESGANIVCPDIYQERATETCELLKKYGGQYAALQTDVSQYNQVQALFQRIMDTFGRIDILVNNAGVAPPSVLIDQIDLTDWHHVIDVDLNGVFYCMKEGLKIMRRQKSGIVINISSVFGVGSDEPEILAQAPYVAAKHAVIGLTKQAAAEYSPFGIRVNCIAPGFIEGTRLPEGSEKRRGQKEKQERQNLLLSRIPLERPGKPHELRALLLLLASPGSSYMTGATVLCDGGFTIW